MFGCPPAIRAENPPEKPSRERQVLPSLIAVTAPVLESASDTDPSPLVIELLVEQLPRGVGDTGCSSGSGRSLGRVVLSRGRPPSGTPSGAVAPGAGSTVG